MPRFLYFLPVLFFKLKAVPKNKNLFKEVANSKDVSKMNGTINNYKRSIKRTSQKHMIIIVDDLKTRAEAAKLVGKKVTYNTGAKDMHGKVASAHGNKGAVRVIFETGMPGQSIGGKVKID